MDLVNLLTPDRVMAWEDKLEAAAKRKEEAEQQSNASKRVYAYSRRRKSGDNL